MTVDGAVGDCRFADPCVVLHSLLKGQPAEYLTFGCFDGILEKQRFSFSHVLLQCVSLHLIRVFAAYTSKTSMMWYPPWDPGILRIRAEMPLLEAKLTIPDQKPITSPKLRSLDLAWLAAAAVVDLCSRRYAHVFQPVARHEFETPCISLHANSLINMVQKVGYGFAMKKDEAGVGKNADHRVFPWLSVVMPPFSTLPAIEPQNAGYPGRQTVQ